LWKRCVLSREWKKVGVVDEERGESTEEIKEEEEGEK